jgi:hypothetical protein
MNGKKFIEKSLLARRKGVINLVVFLIIEFFLKIGGILFLIYVFGTFLFDSKRVKVLGIAESVREAATDSIIAILILGLIPAIICGICTEYLYRKNK